MTKATKFLGIFSLIFILMLSSFDAEAQRRRKSKKRTSRKARTEKVDKDYLSFKDRLWFGSNVDLQLSNGFFQFGLNPMVGYKFTDWLSVGPSLITNYSHTKIYDANNSNIVYNLKSFNYGAGIFARAKFLNQFFFQTEYNISSVNTPVLNGRFYSIVDGKVLATRETRNEMFIGLGYYANGGDRTWGYQITLMYDVLAEDTNSRVPIVYKLGFNYNL